MSKKPIIVIVAHDVGGQGGMESHLEEVIKRLKIDFSVIIVACTLKLKDNSGVQFIRIPSISRPVPIKILLFAIMATFRIMFIKRDVLHTTGAIVFNRADVSTIHFCMDGYRKATGKSSSNDNRSLLQRLNTNLAEHIALIMERLIYKPFRTKKLVTVSNRVKEEILASFPYSASEVQVIPNGVDIHKFLPYSREYKESVRRKLGLPDQGRYLLFMGGDWHRKGLDFVIKAFDKIAVDFPDAYLLVVGKGDVGHYSNQLSSEIRNRVYFTGKQSNPHEWFGVSDMFIFPTSYEAYSLAILEAAASGLTILSTKVSGVEDFIEHSVDGFFIERNVTSIENTLRELLTHFGSMNEFGMKARTKATNMTWDHTYQKFLKIYKQIHLEQDQLVSVKSFEQ
jgi:glycosyltransferase involved in cell wall biosynthesis